MGSALSSLLTYLGFIRRSMTLIVVGLDNAGKTSLLNRIRNNTMVSFAPTQRANLEQVYLYGVDFKAWDLGGHEAVRHLWQELTDKAQVVLFIVDAADPDRFEEAKSELHEMIFQCTKSDPTQSKEEASQKILRPIVLLLNKMDLPYAVDVSTTCKALEIEDFLITDEGEGAERLSRPSEDSIRIVKVFPCSVRRGEGFLEAFKWIAEQE